VISSAQLDHQPWRGTALEERFEQLRKLSKEEQEVVLRMLDGVLQR
jgi:hypothetical protein